MFDLLKKKISGFTQKIQQAITSKEEKEQPAEEETQKEILQEEPISTPKIELPKHKPVIANEEKRDLSAKVRATEKIKSVFTGEIEISKNDLEPFLEELELSLLEADVEQKTSEHIVKELEAKLAGKKFSSRKNIQEQLKEKVRETLLETMQGRKIDLLEKVSSKKPFVIMLLGPNGAGKTTTIAKLAHYFQTKKLTVIFSASDTFRAASIEQLKVHAERLSLRVISHTYGSDPAAVAFDAVKAAEAKSIIDVVLIDTAGRQETNKNLVAELKKIERVAKPDLKIYIGEAIGGQALLSQAKEFDKEIGIDGFILTKMDADPKGGNTISLLFNLKKPILFIGTGQGYSHLEEFSAEKTVEKIV